MFSWALFKQSCKANGWMWAIITFTSCFMLACVMLISGTGNISATKDAVENEIIIGEIDASLNSRSVNYYNISNKGLLKFDEYYVDSFVNDTKEATIYDATFTVWLSEKPDQTKFTSEEAYLQAVQAWQAGTPQPSTNAEKLHAYNLSEWLKKMPVLSDFTTSEAYLKAVEEWNNGKPLVTTASSSTAYQTAVNNLIQYAKDYALSLDATYDENSTEYKEILGDIMYALNPAGQFDSFFTDLKEDVPETYDVKSLIIHVSTSDIETYISSDERVSYREKRAINSSSIFLASNFTSEDTINALIEALSSYGVTKDQYDSFGYTYDSLKNLATSTMVSYQARYDNGIAEINNKKENGEYATDAEYNAAVTKFDEELTASLTKSLLGSLPDEVSEALNEIGKMDIYSLIIGNIFFKMAGLLLPIIFMIMASNNLIAGQVDSGSMAYVLSTSTKRSTVVFTQAMYLITSLLGMFAIIFATGCVCFCFVDVPSSGLTYLKLAELSLGAFLVLFAMSGICYFCSCVFNRSKNAMGIGGGLSMFFLVATMLGLFGSEIIPSVIRLSALDAFNYVSIITLFDVVSITNGTTEFWWKLLILLGIGLVGYIAGSTIFKKKDLPL